MPDTIIVGAISAGATLVVAFLTLFLAEQYRRFHDGSALAAGLAGELSSYEGFAPLLRPRIESWIQISKQGGHKEMVFRPFDKPTDIFFDASVQKLGLLGPALVEHVVYTYGQLRAFRLALDLIQRHGPAMTAAEFELRCTLCLFAMTEAEQRGLYIRPVLHARSSKKFLACAKPLPPLLKAPAKGADTSPG